MSDPGVKRDKGAAGWIEILDGMERVTTPAEYEREKRRLMRAMREESPALAAATDSTAKPSPERS